MRGLLANFPAALPCATATFPPSSPSAPLAITCNMELLYDENYNVSHQSTKKTTPNKKAMETGGFFNIYTWTWV